VKTITHDMLLSTGRTVKHTPEPSGSQFATPTPGPPEMTPEEWLEYCDLVRQELSPRALTQLKTSVRSSGNSSRCLSPWHS
jgi:hypothetical protein